MVRLSIECSTNGAWSVMTVSLAPDACGELVELVVDLVRDGDRVAVGGGGDGEPEAVDPVGTGERRGRGQLLGHGGDVVEPDRVRACRSRKMAPSCSTG